MTKDEKRTAYAIGIGATIFVAMLGWIWWRSRRPTPAQDVFSHEADTLPPADLPMLPAPTPTSRGAQYVVAKRLAPIIE